MPEGMLLETGFLWVANSGGSTISKVDLVTNSVVESIEVGNGPQFLTSFNNDIYISRYFYNPNDYSET